MSELSDIVICHQCARYVQVVGGALVEHERSTGQVCTGSHSFPRVKVTSTAMTGAHPTQDLAATAEQQPPLDQHARPHPGVREDAGPHEHQFLVGHDYCSRCGVPRKEAAGEGPPATDPAPVAEGPARKLRTGDQPLPQARPQVGDIQSLVISDVAARREVGIARYGTALQPFNGRSTLRDAYEEAVDLTVYLRSLLAMQGASWGDLEDAVCRALEQAGITEATHPGFVNRVANIAVTAIADAMIPDAEGER